MFLVHMTFIAMEVSVGNEFFEEEMKTIHMNTQSKGTAEQLEEYWQHRCGIVSFTKSKFL